MLGAVVAFWGKWRLVGGALALLVLAVAQLAFLGDTDEEGGWVNGLHGFLALVILLSATWYAARAARDLGLRGPGPTVDETV